MSHLLDNMIWHALSTGNSDLAERNGNVAMYQEDIAPFAGMEISTNSNLQALHQMVAPNKTIAIAYTDTIDIVATQWTTIQHMDCSQMVYTQIPSHHSQQHNLI